MERSEKGPGDPLPGPNSHGIRRGYPRETPQPTDQLATAEARSQKSEAAPVEATRREPVA
jgi:hypothetical protein